MVAVPAELIEKTPRARALGRLRSYYEGDQYRGLPDFWTGKRHDGSTAPMRERAPCVVYPLPRAMVNQATRFTFGEGRFPRVAVETIEPDAAPGPGLSLSKDEARVLEMVITSIIDQARLRPGIRTALRGGLTVKSGVTVLSVRQGRFRSEYPRAEHCWPTFAPGGEEVEQLTWCFRFDKLVKASNGDLVEQPHFYRRDFTTADTIVYEDAPIEPGKPVVWRTNEIDSQRHGLGFCPVIWTKNLAEESGGIDGVGLYDGLFSEFDALNLALSQRTRGINYWGAPQPWETGVKEGEGPAAAARTAGTARKRKGDDPGFIAASAGNGDAARAVSVDEVWQFEDPEAKVGLLETTGAAFDATTKHVDDIRGRILEATDIVLHDTSAITANGELSGKALALLFAPLLGLVDDLRDCWWPCGLRAVLEMALRMVAVLAPKSTIFLPQVGKAAQILRRFRVQVEGREIWAPPPLTPIWGRYFSPAEAEVKASVDSAIAAKDAGLVSKKTAAAYVADDFGVQDVEAELEEVEEDSLEAAEKALERAQAQADANGDTEGEDDAEGPPGGDPGKVAGDTEAPAA